MIVRAFSFMLLLYLLGFLLACSTISLTGQIDPSRIAPAGGALVSAYLPLLLPFAVMALPFCDLVLAYVRRTIAGKLWYQADKQHLHHRMLGLGHPHRVAVLLLWLLWELFSNNDDNDGDVVTSTTTAATEIVSETTTVDGTGSNGTATSGADDTVTQTEVVSEVTDTLAPKTN